MTITLYERVNRIKLQQAMYCTNLCDKHNDDGTIDTQWPETFRTIGARYLAQPETDKGFKVKYTQNYKFGRHWSRGGILQGCQKRVRIYICGDIYLDIDIVNCHPVILEQLLKKMGIECGEFLPAYNLDRDGMMKLLNLGTKKEFMRVINNEKLTNEALREIHTIVYTLLIPLLIEQNKDIYNKIVKERIMKNKNYNHKGAFIALFLQNIENQLLMVMIEWFKAHKFTVGDLEFDGCKVEKHDLLNEGVLRSVEQEVFDATNYKVQMAFKPMVTDFVPEVVGELPALTKSLPSLSHSIVKAPAQALNTNLTEYKKANQMFTLDEKTNWVVQELLLPRSYKAEPQGCPYCLVNPTHKHSHGENSAIYIDVSKGKVTKSCPKCGTEDLKKSEAKKVINIFMIIMNVESQENNVYQTLVGALLKIGVANDYRREKDTGVVYASIRPYAYERYAEPKDFLNKIFYGDADFKSAPNNMDNMIKFMKQIDDPSFPYIEYDKEWLGFRNGALNIVTCEFTESPPFGMVVRKYFDHEFHALTETPLMDKVLDYQFATDVRDFIYMCIGRLFGVRDNLGFMLYLLGEPGTGRSVVINTVCACFDNIGVVNETFEPKFGLSFLYNKDIVVCDDLPKTISQFFPQQTFQSCITGGKVGVAVKNGSAFTVDGWTVPFLWAGNWYVDYIDKGQITRRVMVAHFERFILVPDTTLEARILKEELPAFIYKCLLAYKELQDRKETRTVWELCPEYFVDQQLEFKMARNPLFSFLNENAHYKEGAVTSMEKVRESFGHSMGKSIKILDNGTFPQVNKAWVVDTIRVCKNCKNEFKKGCCNQYPKAGKTTRKVIKNMEFKAPLAIVHTSSPHHYYSEDELVDIYEKV